jgi:lipopolysaccharide/colanic/teichoic acid biosynthesis glycosyltransferase
MKTLKALFDGFFALLLLILLAPAFAIVAALIKIDSKGPVFFLQERVGKDGKVFRIHKFRTMVVNAINMGHGVSVAENDPRITRVGKFLRDWSIDELPQLIDVFTGRMSFVGPRPTLQYQVDQYTAEQRQRLKMRPGITGLAQVSGRKGIPWAKRIEFDVWYVNHWSPWLDFRILLRTVRAAVFKKEGLHCGDNMKEFKIT